MSCCFFFVDILYLSLSFWRPKYPVTFFIYLFIFFYFLERKYITKTTSSKTRDDHSSTLTPTKETTEARDDFSSRTFSSEKHTDPTLSSKSDVTTDLIFSSMSDHNPQSKKANFFWIFILLPLSCLILILIAVIGWIFVKCIMKRRCSTEIRVNSSSNEDFEMTSVFNEHFQETSFDAGR